MQLGHILVPTDFSEGSEEAFATALVLARDSGARVTLLHVHPLPPTMVLPDVLVPISPGLMRSVEHSVELALEQLCDRARARGVVCNWATAIGSATAEICSTAPALEVDLVVIGAHGKGGLGHAILGSVAEKVVRKAPCAVLTVRPEMRSFVQPRDLP
jgi:nucleotide-binding universal stress UspA family protein